MAMTPERKALRAAYRKRDHELNKLTSIADKVGLIGNILTVQIDGVVIQGEIENFNAVLKRLGYRPVRRTRNMLNSEAGEFCIDINTPIYCDPGYESYHTM
jgi:hypothetical protein